MISPEATAERLLKLGRDVDALAVVTVDHPRITEAIERLRANRVPVVAVISDLTGVGAHAGYVGLDNWKSWRNRGLGHGETYASSPERSLFSSAIIAICARTCARSASARIFGSVPPTSRCSTPSRPSKIASTPIKARSTSCTTPPISIRTVHRRRAESPACCRDFAGTQVELAKTLNVVGLDLTPEARSGLLDGVVDVILSHPITSLAETTVELLASVTAGETNGEPVQRLLPFEIYTPENPVTEVRIASAALTPRPIPEGPIGAAFFRHLNRRGMTLTSSFHQFAKPSRMLRFARSGRLESTLSGHSGSSSIRRNWAGLRAFVLCQGKAGILAKADLDFCS